MKLWLASYPRSGNTFFRVVLHEVYGVESAEHARTGSQPNYQDYPVVKTHELPEHLVPADPSIPAVYLVRDGRDALVSMARQRSNLVVPGSNYWMNLFRCICWHRKGDYFGGWSRNVHEWRKRAAIVLRFEDLIADPIGCVERTRPWFDLPAPRPERLLSFEQLREREVRFDAGPSVFSFGAAYRRKFFRRGKVGAWKDELPLGLRWLFYLCHGRTLRELGYSSNAGHLPEMASRPTARRAA